MTLADLAGPADLAGLSTADLSGLAGEIREFLIEKVRRGGGASGRTSARSS